jgi:uncharacterized protein (DUF924 family)
VSKHWFNSTPELDNEIRERFESLWREAASGQHDDWLENAEAALALVIVLDQFPLNMFRGQVKSFATEQRAIDICREAIAKGFDQQLPENRLAFLYLPLMHSENIEDQDLSVELFRAAGLKNNLRFAEHHREIIRRFGRFPHRNAILGRDSTAEELNWLASPEAFKG